MYVLSVQYSCAVVSVFLLWQESLFSTHFLVESKNFLLVFLALYGSTTIQSQLFLRNIENFVWFPKQYILGFFLLEIQLANIPDRGFLFLHNTLFYSTLLALTHGQKDWQRVKYTRYAWAGGTFFPVVLLCQYLVLVENRFWFLHTTYMYSDYNTVVVLC
jgi:hypothetical protein